MAATADPVVSAEAQRQELAVPAAPEARAVPDTTAPSTVVKLERTAAAAESVDVVAMQSEERTAMVERAGMRALPATVEVA
jgi:hypothetical protein